MELAFFSFSNPVNSGVVHVTAPPRGRYVLVWVLNPVPAGHPDILAEVEVSALTQHSVSGQQLAVAGLHPRVLYWTRPISGFTPQNHIIPHIWRTLDRTPWLRRTHWDTNKEKQMDREREREGGSYKDVKQEWIMNSWCTHSSQHTTGVIMTSEECRVGRG